MAAGKLATVRTIQLAGDAVGSANFDGSGNVVMNVTVAGLSAAGNVVGDIALKSFRIAELPFGWYFANGDQYALTSPQGAALNKLSANYKADFGIFVSGSNINLPNMFYTDGRGFFLRAVNGSVRQVGSVVNDQMRPITGTDSAYNNSTGKFYAGGGSGDYYFSAGASSRNLMAFNSGRLGANFNGAKTQPLRIYS